MLERDERVQERLAKVADRVFVGDANDREALMNAGLEDAPSVLLTTSDDAVNVYLAVYCRRLKSDLRIVSRITHHRNLEAIHRAGADFALSYSSLGAEAVVSFIEGHELVSLEENLDLFSVQVPRSLENKPGRQRNRLTYWAECRCGPAGWPPGDEPSGVDAAGARGRACDARQHEATERVYGHVWVVVI